MAKHKKNKEKLNEVESLINDEIEDKKINEDTDINAAESELFEPNTPSKEVKKSKLFFTFFLVIIAAALAFNLFYKTEKPLEVDVKAKSEPSSLIIEKLAMLLSKNEEVTIDTKITDTSKVNSDKIKWSTSSNVVSLEDCQGSSCKIKAESLGETTITASYDKTNYDTIKIKVLDNNHIYVYKNDYYNGEDVNYTLYATTTKNDSKVEEYDYTCVTLNCSAKSTTNNNIFIKDDNYYLINFKSGEKTSFDLDFSKYTNYTIIDSSTKFYGFILDSKSIYSVAEKGITLTNINGYIYYNDNLLSNNTILISNTENSYLTNLNSGKKITTFKGQIFEIENIKINKTNYYVFNYDPESGNYKIFDTKYNLLIDDVSYYDIDNNSNTMAIIHNNGKVFEEYDDKLNLINTSAVYKRVYQFVKGYVVVLDNDNNLNLINKDGSLVITFTKLSNTMYYHFMLSGYYEENGKSGIYAIVEDSSLGENVEGMNQGYRYYYNPSTGETNRELTAIGGYAKPILYLYPTKNKTKITITFAHPEYLDTTYPKYNKKWVVTANKDGSLYDQKGKYYYALYWDENKYQKTDFKTGFYVTKDNASDFLETKLNQIGLTRREANEFIMYWLPILERNQKNLVYFELTESREAFNKLNINPKPDSLLRVAIHIKKVNKKITIKEEKLSTFKRTGFTAVEWGGINY